MTLTKWAPGQMTTSELARDRANLEHKLSGNPDNETWAERLKAIKDEQAARTEAARRSRAAAAALREGSMVPADAS